jgi:aspartyl-tRNA(Asn)/glutamyl-tRNA(Gln) amidotransferase subunit C
MSLSPEEVRAVARLARLDVAADELADVTTRLNAILGYVEQLRSVATDGVEPLAHPLPIQNIFRLDDPRSSLPVDEALRNAPARAGYYFAVPAVFDD